MAEVKKGWTPPVPVLVLLAGLVVVTLLFEWLLFLSARQQAQDAPKSTVHSAAPKVLVNAELDRPKAAPPKKPKTPKPAAAPAKPKPAPEPKKEEPASCAIQIPGSPDMRVPAFPTEEGHDEFGRAAAQGLSDRDMMLVLTSNRGKLIQPGTRCLYVEVGWLGSSRARMLEGTFAGQTYWFPTEWTRGGK